MHNTHKKIPYFFIYTVCITHSDCSQLIKFPAAIIGVQLQTADCKVGYNIGYIKVILKPQGCPYPKIVCAVVRHLDHM